MEEGVVICMSKKKAGRSSRARNTRVAMRNAYFDAQKSRVEHARQLAAEAMRKSQKHVQTIEPKQILKRQPSKQRFNFTPRYMQSSEFHDLVKRSGEAAAKHVLIPMATEVKSRMQTLKERRQEFEPMLEGVQHSVYNSRSYDFYSRVEDPVKNLMQNISAIKDMPESRKQREYEVMFMKLREFLTLKTSTEEGILETSNRMQNMRAEVQEAYDRQKERADELGISEEQFKSSYYEVFREALASSKGMYTSDDIKNLLGTLPIDELMSNRDNIVQANKAKLEEIALARSTGDEDLESMVKKASQYQQASSKIFDEDYQESKREQAQARESFERYLTTHDLESTANAINAQLEMQPEAYSANIEFLESNIKMLKQERANLEEENDETPLRKRTNYIRKTTELIDDLQEKRIEYTRLLAEQKEAERIKKEEEVQDRANRPMTDFERKLREGITIAKPSTVTAVDMEEEIGGLDL